MASASSRLLIAEKSVISPHISCCCLRGQLVFQVEDFLKPQEPRVRGCVAEVGEEVGHLGLPAGVYLGGGHPGERLLQRRSFDVADEQPVFAQEQRVVVPAGCGQCREHVWPDGRVSRLVLVDPVGFDLELETHALHDRSPSRDEVVRPALGVPAGPASTQKLKSPMLLASNTNGSPRNTVASASTVYSPSRPASNVSPSSPVMSPLTSAAAAKAAR